MNINKKTLKCLNIGQNDIVSYIGNLKFKIKVSMVSNSIKLLWYEAKTYFKKLKKDASLKIHF